MPRSNRGKRGAQGQAQGRKTQQPGDELPVEDDGPDDAPAAPHLVKRLRAILQNEPEWLELWEEYCEAPTAGGNSSLDPAHKKNGSLKVFLEEYDRSKNDMVLTPASVSRAKAMPRQAAPQMPAAAAAPLPAFNVFRQAPPAAVPRTISPASIPKIGLPAPVKIAPKMMMQAAPAGRPSLMTPRAPMMAPMMAPMQPMMAPMQPMMAPMAAGPVPVPGGAFPASPYSVAARAGPAGSAVAPTQSQRQQRAVQAPLFSVGARMDAMGGGGEIGTPRHASSVSIVKNLQGTYGLMARNHWHSLCDDHGGGKYDPSRQPLMFLENYIRQMEALIETNKHIVNEVKTMQKRSDEHKQDWERYCDNEADGTRDPKKHEAWFLQRWLDLMRQKDPKAGGSKAGPSQEEADKKKLIHQVRKLQAQSGLAREEWNRYCDEKSPNSVRDPKRHTVAFLSEFLLLVEDMGISLDGDMQPPEEEVVSDVEDAPQEPQRGSSNTKMTFAARGATRATQQVVKSFKAQAPPVAKEEEPKVDDQAVLNRVKELSKSCRAAWDAWVKLCDDQGMMGETSSQQPEEQPLPVLRRYIREQGMGDRDEQLGADPPEEPEEPEEPEQPPPDEEEEFEGDPQEEFEDFEDGAPPEDMESFEDGEQLDELPFEDDEAMAAEAAAPAAPAPTGLVQPASPGLDNRSKKRRARRRNGRGPEGAHIDMVNEVKRVQKLSGAHQALWHEHCDGEGGGMRDPRRQPEDFLMAYLEKASNIAISSVGKATVATSAAAAAAAAAAPKPKPKIVVTKKIQPPLPTIASSLQMGAGAPSAGGDMPAAFGAGRARIPLSRMAAAKDVRQRLQQENPFRGLIRMKTDGPAEEKEVPEAKRQRLNPPGGGARKLK